MQRIADLDGQRRGDSAIDARGHASENAAADLQAAGRRKRPRSPRAIPANARGSADSLIRGRSKRAISEAGSCRPEIDEREMLRIDGGVARLAPHEIDTLKSHIVRHDDDSARRNGDRRTLARLPAHCLPGV